MSTPPPQVHPDNPISPELVSQLLTPELDAHLPAGSNTLVRWRCPKDPRHIWSSAPNTRRRSPRCPVCLNKVTLPGVNDLAATHPELASQLVHPQATAIHAGAHAKVEWSCPDPDHPTWKASPVSRVRLSSGCPYCSGRLPVPGVSDLATTHPDLITELVDPSQVATLGAGSSKKVRWKCLIDPDHPDWEASVRNRARKKPTGCPACANRTRH